MEIGFLSQIHIKETYIRFQRAAGRMGISLRILHPAPLMMHIQGDKLVLLDHKHDKVNIDGILNWDPYPVFGIMERACSYINIPFMNTTMAVNAARNKVLTALALQKSDLPQPEALYLNIFARNLPRQISLPAVYKPKGGARGYGIKKFMDRDSLSGHIQGISKGKDIFLQGYVPNDGWDMRVVVVGDKVLGATKRIAGSGEWRTSYQFGGRLEPYKPDNTVRDLGLKAARALGLDFAGVDIMQDKRDGSYKILEVNSVPCLKTFEDITGLDVAQAILRHMAKFI